jgi:serine protease AprX
MDSPPSPEIDTEVDPLVTYSAPPLRIRWGFCAISAVALLIAAVSLSSALTPAGVPSSPANGHPAAATMDGGASPALVKVAAAKPGKQVEAIVQFKTGVEPSAARQLVRMNGGRVTGDLHVINGLAARMSASEANRLAARDGVRAVSLNAVAKPQSIDTSQLVTSYNQSIGSDKVWADPATGKGVGVAVIDTGIAGNLPDFKVSQSNGASRVVASAVTNPYAKTATDTYGHGTHVAGIIAGNGNSRSSSDSLRGEYIGVAPEANLISIKASDDKGEATVLDAIYGLQFAVDFKDDYNIRVANLSLESSVAESYKTDPLDAAVESAWFSGIVVVAAAGNRGQDSDAVRYAPGNDPFVVSVGAVDDLGTKSPYDDQLASWSSRGQTQDGFNKPEVLAPGAHIVSTLAPNSSFTSLCPSCIVGGQYIRAGGTSMSAPMVAGLVANMLEVHPDLTPNQVKGILMDTARSVSGAGKEIYANPAINQSSGRNANAGIQPNSVVNPTTGAIDYTRSRWSRSRWSTAPSTMGASWARSRWSCNCSRTSSGSIDPTRSSWSRSRWSTSWTK